jgi:hypothetical protein
MVLQTYFRNAKESKFGEEVRKMYYSNWNSSAFLDLGTLFNFTERKWLGYFKTIW